MTRYRRTVTRAAPSAESVRKGAVLGAARMAARLSQRELGARLGVVGHTVMRWEAGRFAPRGQQRAALLAALREAGAPNLEAVAAALGLEEVASARASALDQAVRDAAEIADAKPSAMRAALAHVLARAAEAGVTLAELRGRVEDAGANARAKSNRKGR